MSDWSRMARGGAARAWGARHYRWYAAREYAGTLAAVAAVLAGLAAVAGGAWWLLQRVPAPIVLLAGAGAALTAAALRLWYLMVRARGSGGSLGLVALVVVAVACVISAAKIS